MAESPAAGAASTVVVETAREAIPTISDPTPIPAPEPNEPAAQPAPPAFDADAEITRLKNAPEDFYERLVQEAEPLRRKVSAESSRAIQRAQDQALREREQREVLETRQREQADLDRAYELALSDDLAVDPDERDRALKRVREHRQYQQVRDSVVKDRSVQEWAIRQAGVQVALQVAEHPDLKPYYEAANGSEAESYGDLTLRVARAYHDARLKELEPAIRADERTRRLQALPNPDLARSQGMPETRGGWTVERYQSWLATKQGPAPSPAEIDALTTGYSRAS